MSTWYPWHPDRYDTSRRARQLRTMEHHGIYRKLLDEQWRDGALPDDLETLGAMMPVQCDRNAIAYVLETCFDQQEDGTWIEPVLEEIREEQREKYLMRSRAGRKAAEARWGKVDRATRKSKRPNGSMRTQSDRSAKAVPSDSDRNANAMRDHAIGDRREEIGDNPPVSPPLDANAMRTHEEELPPEDDRIVTDWMAFLDDVAALSPLEPGEIEKAKVSVREKAYSLWTGEDGIVDLTDAEHTVIAKDFGLNYVG